MDYRNLAEMQRLQAERHGPAVALRYPRHGIYHDITWQQYREMTEVCALALIEAGIQIGDRVGLLAENRAEWLIADMAILAARAVNVPPHAPMTARQVLFQLGETEVRWLFISTAEQLDKIRQIAGDLPNLRGVVVFRWKCRSAFCGDLRWPICARPCYLGWVRTAWPNGPGSRRIAELLAREAEAGPRRSGDDHVHLGNDRQSQGRDADARQSAQQCGGLVRNPRRVRMGNILLWLPYSHIYARTVDHYLCQLLPMPLCLAESQETMRQQSGARFGGRPTCRRCGVCMKNCSNFVADSDPAKTRKRLQDIFGPQHVDWRRPAAGHLLPLPVAQAYQQAGLLLLQGYGMTESSPVISFNRRTRYNLASVGPPLPGVEVQIAADGEVLTRGPHVMKGYWKRSMLTAEANPRRLAAYRRPGSGSTMTASCSLPAARRSFSCFPAARR